MPAGFHAGRQALTRRFESDGGSSIQATFQTGWFKKPRSAGLSLLAYLPRFRKTVLVYCLQAIDQSAVRFATKDAEALSLP